ncbi:aminopeptidase [Nanoarchaeota archaeon]
MGEYESRLAEIVANHSFRSLPRGSEILISSEYIAKPLYLAIQEALMAKGHHVTVDIICPESDHLLLDKGSDEQIGHIPDHLEPKWKEIDARIKIIGSEYPTILNDIPGSKHCIRGRAKSPINKIAGQKQHWIGVLYPTEAMAELEGMPFSELRDFVHKAAIQDYGVLRECMLPIANAIQDGKELVVKKWYHKDERLLELKMDISLSLGETGDGRHNIPAGEVLTSPDARSVEGEIYSDIPIYYKGEKVCGVYLKFEKGKVVDYSAESGHKVLEGLLNTSEGAKMVGEIAVGMNLDVTRTFKSITLFTEKIGGTLHFALGNSFPVCYVPESELYSEESQRVLKEYAEKGIMVERAGAHVDFPVDFRNCKHSDEGLYVDHKAFYVKNRLWLPDSSLL